MRRAAQLRIILGKAAAEARRHVHPLLWVLVLAVALKQYLFVAELDRELLQLRVRPLLLCATLGAALVLLPWAALLRPAGQLVALVLVDLLLTVVGVGDLIYHRQFSDLTSVASLRFAYQLVDVGGATGSLIRPADLWFFADLPLLAAIALVPAWRVALGRRLPRRAVAVALLIGAVLGTRAFVKTPRLRYRYVGSAFIAGDLGIVGYHLLDAVSYGRRLAARLLPAGEGLERARAYLATRRSAGAGEGEALNLIVVQLESYQAFPLGLVQGGKPVTPHLDRLAEESVVFENFFAQTGQGSTSDAEFLANCSLHSSRTGAVFFDHAGNDLACMPELLADRGYATHVFHSNQAGFWNRAGMYPQMGYQRFHHRDDFVQDEKIGLGLSDRSFLLQTADKLRALSEPFYAFVITLTSHSPFAFPEIPPSVDLGKLEGTPIDGYLESAHYTDAALGTFVERLRSDGILDRSVLVVYGDHAGVTRARSNLADFLPIEPADEWGWFLAEKRVPLLIRFPAGKRAAVRTEVAGELDLAPTLAQLVGVPPEATAFVGRDLFGLQQTDPFVAFHDGSAICADKLYLSGDLGAPRCVGPEGELPLAACGTLARRAETELSISREIVEKDLVGALVREFPRKVAVSE